MNKIIAFTGLPMTGKSTARKIMQRLLDEKGIANDYVHLGSTEEVARRDVENDWTSEESVMSQGAKEQLIRERWRSESGMGVMAEKATAEIKDLLENGKVVVIDNLYSDEERTVLRKHFGEDCLLVVALAADWHVRVRRGNNRPERPLTAEEIKERDHAEVYNLHRGPTIALADFMIVNNIDEQSDADGAQKVIETALRERVLPVLLS